MTSSQPSDGPAAVDLIGPNVRAAREAQGMSLRELARRIDVSPSFISQLERNKANASVGTLYALVDVLGLSIDQLMATQRGGSDQTPDATVDRHRTPGPAFQVERPLQSADGRAQIQFPGVTWERLTRAADPQVDFLQVTYSPGSASCADDDMMRHGGYEYGLLLKGALTVQVGFERYEMSSGDSITFDSMTPHRLSNDGEHDAVAVWVVVGRRSDARAHDVPVPSSSVTHLPSLTS